MSDTRRVSSKDEAHAHEERLSATAEHKEAPSALQESPPMDDKEVPADDNLLEPVEEKSSASRAFSWSEGTRTKEFNIAKQIFESMKGELDEKETGYKISRKDYKDLTHSFTFVKNDEGTWVAYAHAGKDDRNENKTNYLGANARRKVAKLVEDIHGDLHVLKILKKDDRENDTHYLKIAGMFRGGYRKKEKEYIVMDYIPGRPLSAFRPKHLSIEENARIALNILGAIDSDLYSRGICHNDLHANNIMVGDAPDYPVRIIDFGLSTILTDENADIDTSRTHDLLDQFTGLHCNRDIGITAPGIANPKGIILLYCEYLEKEVFASGIDEDLGSLISELRHTALSGFSFQSLIHEIRLREDRVFSEICQ